MSIDQSNITDVVGTTVYSFDGERIGEAERVYVDDQSDRPTWLTVRTSSFRPTEYFVPLVGANMSPDGVRVNYDKITVEDAPRVDVDTARLSEPEEIKLSRHYGLEP